MANVFPKILPLLVTFALVACDKKAEPAPQPAAAETKAPEAKPEAKPEPKPEPVAEPAKAPAEPAKAPVADAGTAPSGDTGGDPAPIPAIPDPPVTAVSMTPGMIVRETKPDSPEWLIQQVLVASMEPDEAKGWELFASLLHEDQKIENALISRRQLNYPASRRKVKLFLFEDPTKPYYKVDRVLEESPKLVRIFVHNNSEGGMPTPCELRFDDNLKKWRIGICSL